MSHLQITNSTEAEARKELGPKAKKAFEWASYATTLSSFFAPFAVAVGLAVTKNPDLVVAGAGLVAASASPPALFKLGRVFLKFSGEGNRDPDNFITFAPKDRAFVVATSLLFGAAYTAGGLMSGSISAQTEKYKEERRICQNYTGPTPPICQ